MTDATLGDGRLAEPVPPTSPPAQPPVRTPSGPAAPPADDSVMTLVDHLTEFRSRLVRSALAVAAGAAVGWFAAPALIHVLKAPIGDRPLLFLSPGEGFLVYVKVALTVGIILAMPVLLYQLWAFVAPGLTREERRMVRPWIPLALVLFAVGVGVAWVVLPFAMAFLLAFQSGDLQAAITAAHYFGFVTTLFLAFGLVMEFPILLFGLSRVGIVTSARLRGVRRYVIVGIALFSAVVTPGGDLVSPTVLGVTMYLLFEASIWVIRRTGR